jgi:hypothetical protein
MTLTRMGQALLGRRARLIALLVCAVGGGLWWWSRALPYAIRVTATVSEGQSMEVFFNDFAGEPLRVPITPNEQTVYEFTPWNGAITRLRLDPTQASGASIHLSRVEIAQGGRVVASFGPQDLAGWSYGNVSQGPEDAQGLALVSTSDDPDCISSTLALPSASRRTIVAPARPALAVLIAAAGLVLLTQLVVMLDNADREEETNE